MGYYVDTSFFQHGFILPPGGNPTNPNILDVPGSTNTAAYGINPAGQITGNYTDSSFVYHGFLRSP